MLRSTEVNLVMTRAWATLVETTSPSVCISCHQIIMHIINTKLARCIKQRGCKFEWWGYKWWWFILGHNSCSKVWIFSLFSSLRYVAAGMIKKSDAHLLKTSPKPPPKAEKIRSISPKGNHSWIITPKLNYMNTFKLYTLFMMHGSFS